MGDHIDNQESVLFELARFEALASNDMRAKLSDETLAAFRWMVASLFALNGGGLLALVSKTGVEIHSSQLGFWLFFAGVMSTFVTVLIAQQADSWRLSVMHAMGQYWTRVAATKKRETVEENRLKLISGRAERLSNFARLLAIFPMVWFGLGMYSLGIGDEQYQSDRSDSALNHELGAPNDINDQP